MSDSIAQPRERSNNGTVAHPPKGHICLLPVELLLQINSYLDRISLAVLSVTCKVCLLRAGPIVPVRLNTANLIYRSSAHQSCSLIFVGLPLMKRAMFWTVLETDLYMSYSQSSWSRGRTQETINSAGNSSLRRHMLGLGILIILHPWSTPTSPSLGYHNI